jgi:D-beta-D-heptose 7-phosphate kinase/D-beta-D-heptose 1-phosphate adenosyltransferase
MAVWSKAAAAAQVRRWQQAGEKVVFTNGCFDLLHRGHVEYLAAAKQLGDRLIVGLNSDRSVRELKGPGRPLQPAEDRAAILAALAAVDGVVIFNESTPRELIVALHPDVIVKGGDYQPETVVGATEVESWGGEVMILPYLAGRSTRALIQRIQRLPADGSADRE